MGRKIATLVYDSVQELDVFGPWEVLQASKYLQKADDEIYTVAMEDGVVKCFGGTKIIPPDYTVENMPKPDILFIPGTVNLVPQIKNRAMMEWIKRSVVRLSGLWEYVQEQFWWQLRGGMQQVKR